MIVRYRDRAKEDIANIHDRIARENKLAAQRVEDAIRDDAELIGVTPELGVATGYQDTRRWPMPQFDYAIFYRIDWEADCIDVLRIIHGKQVRNLKRVPR